MSLSIEIQKMPKNSKEVRTVSRTGEVFELEEVQEIKDAVQEHLLMIGLDRRNNVRNVTLVGIGSSGSVPVDSKYIVRTALVNACDKVILVHNHPSNILEPSDFDKHISNITYKLLDSFNIEFIDHIIVGKDKCLSMEKIKAIDRDYKDKRTETIDIAVLTEENIKLKEENRRLKSQLQKKKIKEKDEELEF